MNVETEIQRIQDELRKLIDRLEILKNPNAEAVDSWGYPIYDDSWDNG